MASTPISYSPPLGAPNEENPLVYFDIKLGRYGEGTKLGRVVFELKSDITPKTAENFVVLSEQNYANSRFHRIIPGFMCQGGALLSLSGLQVLDRLTRPLAPSIASLAWRFL